MPTPIATETRCYLRLLANWGLGLAGLPLCIDSDSLHGKDASPSAPLGQITRLTVAPPLPTRG